MKNDLSAVRFLSISIGVIFLWFGVLKFFPSAISASPPDLIAKQIIKGITLGKVTGKTALTIMAIWETLIGLAFIFNRFTRQATYLAILHVVISFSPIFSAPKFVFNDAPFNLTFIGEYLVKNLVVLAALFVVLPQTSSK